MLEHQVRRMLADERSETLVSNFAGQWLYLRNLASSNPDMRLFAGFDDNLRQAFRRETELFFDSIMREDRNVLDLLSANYTFLNERLAKHYGIPNVYGSRFRHVELGESAHRGGLLGQGSILTVTSYANRTSPVIRGKWILSNILGVAPPPPPGKIPPLKENAGVEKVVSMRETDGAASRQSGLCGLPCADGPHRVRHGELRCRRPLAHARKRYADRCGGRFARRQQVRGSCRPAKSASEPARGLRRYHDGETYDVLARARRRVLR